ncbi:sulfotransferase domain-containing protein [Flavobacterium flavipallidum]|uniref:Sulfotransferase domain-containing protein n=1 Tax=Flavobacterium flavipallidum TaxID=3139140 RepID=A0ABU9HIC9_9FLAO
MDNNIIWLASYPKSGNTWFRSFLTALLNDGEIDINKMDTDGIFSDKGYIETILDLSSDDLRPTEFESFRKIAFGYRAQELKKEAFIKIHDAYTFDRWNALPLIPNAGSRIAIYLVRNPLDVVLSLANHTGLTIDETIDKYLNSEEGAFVKKWKIGQQYYQLLGTWAMHASSWMQQKEIPVHIIRYEDMKSNPFQTFKLAVDKMQLNYSDDAIINAIEATDFKKLKNQEENKGFKEKQLASSAFFFKGETGRWKKELTNEQIQKIMTVNESMMKRLGYWEETINQLNN